jgi:hypothetical protein
MFYYNVWTTYVTHYKGENDEGGALSNGGEAGEGGSL